MDSIRNYSFNCNGCAVAKDRVCNITCPLNLDPRGDDIYPYCYNCMECVDICQKNGEVLNISFNKNKLGEKYMEKETAPKQSRREFLTKLGVFGALTIAIVAFARNLYLFFTPSKKEKTYHKYLVGKVDEIPVGKAKEIMIQKKPVFVVHLEDGFKVFSGICTHLGCIVKWEENKSRFYCPCHKGIFDKTGKVTGGPPPRQLDEFEVEMDDNLVFVKVEDKDRSPWS